MSLYFAVILVAVVLALLDAGRGKSPIFTAEGK